MRIYIMLAILIATGIALMLTSVAANANSGGGAVMVTEQGKQILDADIQKIVNKVKNLSKKYLISREQAKRDKGLIGEERKGTSDFKKIYDKNSKTEVELIYDDHLKSVTEAVITDKHGNKQFFYYTENGDVYSYIESKNEKAHGVYLFFNTEGLLIAFAEFKDNKYVGREMEWDESGKLIRSIINDGTKEFKIGE